MENQVIVRALRSLQQLVAVLRDAKVNSKADYTRWSKDPGNLAFLEKVFGYDQLSDDRARAKISSLVKPHFHPDYPIIGFNYTPLAHNTLHAYPEGWTPALRLCRGIVFDLETTELLALAWEKFYNYGENPETSNLPAGEYYTATEKHDGHLGIIFRYRDQLLITTRGDFTSATSKIATEMLPRYSRLYTRLMSRCGCAFRDYTLLVEIIHPQTRVIRDYGNEEKFVLIGCRRNPLKELPELEQLPSLKGGSPIDLTYDEFDQLGAYLCIEVAKSISGLDVNDMLKEINRRDVINREGWVATLKDGRRIKFKYVNYIGEMVRRKLSLSYLMKRGVSGNLEKMVATLPEEIYDEALKMLGKIATIMFAPGDAKSKWRRLYELVSEDEQTDSYKLTCREFARAFTRDSDPEIKTDDMCSVGKKRKQETQYRKVLSPPYPPKHTTVEAIMAAVEKIQETG